LICELISFGNRIAIRENGVVFEFYLPADHSPWTFFKWLASALQTQSIAMCKSLRPQTPVSKHEFPRQPWPLLCREPASKLHSVKAF